jgi:hypothetical protein
MNIKTSLTTALAILLFAGAAFAQPFAQFTEGRALESDRRAAPAPAAPSAVALVGFWRGAYVDSVDGLNSFSTRFEISFGADGRFESRNAAVQPTLFDNMFQMRTDHWKGAWIIKGDSIVLTVKACLVNREGSAVETCEYLQDEDSSVVFRAGLLKKGAVKTLDLSDPFDPVEMVCAGASAHFILPSLFADNSLSAKSATVQRDRSWALSFGNNAADLAYAEPDLERDAAVTPAHRAGAPARLYR